MSNAASYFAATGDRDSKVWVFRDDIPSRFPLRNFSCGTDEFGIHVIDLFGGCHPILMSHESLNGEIRIPFRPTVILDSNVVSYLHQYVTSDSALGELRRRTVEELLRFFVRNGLDYNPFFYYMEAASGTMPSSLLGHTERFSESILRLHTMDARHFLTSGEIKAGPVVLRKYQEKYSLLDFEELAACHARKMIGPVDFQIEWFSKLAYAGLLKAALIHKTSKRGIGAKYQEFRAFMEETFNIALGLQRMIALEYFAGMFDDFIPVQRGAVPERALRRIRASARDLTLLDLPSYLLVAGPPEAIYLSSVCTSDRAIKVIASAYCIEGVMAWAPKVRTPLPVVTYDLSALSRDVGDDVVRGITEIDAAWQDSRVKRWSASEEHISFEQLNELIKQLESQVTAYCYNGSVG